MHLRHPHRLSAALLPALTAFVAVLGLVSVPVVFAPAVAAQGEPALEPTAVIEGKGWGHGVGMAQDGALALGREGASTADILQHFYPGTSLGQDGGDVRVVVQTAPGGEAVVSFPGGGEVRSSRDGAQDPGFPVTVAPGGSVRMRFDGAYRAEPLSSATLAALAVGPPTMMPAPAAQTEEEGELLGGTITLPPPTEPAPPTDPAPPPSPGMTLPPPPPPAPPAGGEGAPARPSAGPEAGDAPPPSDGAAISGSPLWAVPRGGATVGVPARSATYRGAVQASAAGGGLRLVNVVDVEDYLRGMGEVLDSSWPQASLGAQAVAARTYALRAMDLSGELCDTQACQVYLGTQAEYRAMDAAVAATRGQVVQSGGRLAQTVYSASGGGITATPEEGFGTSGQGLPYLGVVSYPTADPQAWDLRLSLAQLGRRFAYPGTVTDVRVATTGPSGRALTIELVGDAGPRELPALSFDDTLGLRSTLYTVRVEALPPPPPDSVETDDGTDTSRTTRGTGARSSASAVAGQGQGRLLGSDDLVTVAALAHLEDPLRTAAALASAVLLIGVCAGAAFRLAAGGAARPRPRQRATAGPKEPAVASIS